VALLSGCIRSRAAAGQWDVPLEHGMRPSASIRDRLGAARRVGRHPPGDAAVRRARQAFDRAFAAFSSRARRIEARPMTSSATGDLGRGSGDL
jgi:hypothetical protein